MRYFEEKGDLCQGKEGNKKEEAIRG